MPEITHGAVTWTVPTGSNLLDALNACGLNVPYSCRAGSCQACLVRCLTGEPEDALPDALDPALRLKGWRLACQCAVTDDIRVSLFDPVSEGLPAVVHGLDWLNDEVLRLRLVPERPLRYQAGQHLVLWTEEGVARPYSLASIPAEDSWLEFHIDCRRPGAFSEAARTLGVGNRLRLGQLHSGALHYDPSWQHRPLLLMASGTGLAPLWGILREALGQQHKGSIRLLHVCRGESYLQAALTTLVEGYENLAVDVSSPEQLPNSLQAVRLASRQTLALICGSNDFVDACAKRMFMLGLPRGQVFSDAFIARQR